MSCNRCNCNRVLKGTSYTVGNSFNINVTDTNITDLDNGQRFVLILQKDLPAMTTIVPVILVINGVNYPMQDILGNNLMSDQLRFFPQRCSCRGREGIIRIVFGANPNHFKVLQCLPNSAAIEFEEDIEETAVVTTKSTVQNKVENK